MSAIEKKAARLHVKRTYKSTKRPVNDNFFSELNEESAYVFGLWSADGYMYKEGTKHRVSLTLKESDRYHVERIASMLDCACSTKTYNGFGRTTLTVNSIPMYLDLLRLGGTPAKSCNMLFPSVREDLVRHYIRGVFDGDGCFTTRKVYKVDGTYSLWGRASICNGGEFLESLYSKVHDSIGIEGIIGPTKSRAKELRFYISKYRDLYDYLYKDTDLYLIRKEAKFKEYLDFRGL